MAYRRGSVLLAVPVLVLSLFLVGCPKRPATTAASAPPPTGSPSSSAAPSTSPSSPSMTPSPAAPSTSASPTTPPRPSEFSESANLKDVFFDFDKYDIRPSDAKILDTNATWLKSNNNLVLIEGHCDERGTNEYNLALGERRGKAIRDYLIAKGIAAERINTVSYGEERPVCMEKNEDCYKRNRRGDFLARPK